MREKLFSLNLGCENRLCYVERPRRSDIEPTADPNEPSIELPAGATARPRETVEAAAAFFIGNFAKLFPSDDDLHLEMDMEETIEFARVNPGMRLEEAEKYMKSLEW